MRAQKVRNSSRALSMSVDKASSTRWASCELAPTTFGLVICYTEHFASISRVVAVDHCVVLLIFFEVGEIGVC
eukprot:10602572-Prorocentrum_lima.AAC.1